ncbi:hypothetical protein RB195_001256 [Necator americanus]|uniref:Uncharacterized protein n=1 Tax=Necator americanus TaxID=51031 RepID=A0ABR1DDG7_NECAM
MSLKNRTVSGPERINLEHVKCLPPVLINMLVRLFTRFPLDCKAPKEWKTSRIVILYKKDDTQDIETWALRKQEENVISVIERGIECVMLGVTCVMQLKEGIRSSLLRHRWKIRDATAYAKESKIRVTTDNDLLDRGSITAWRRRVYLRRGESRLSTTLPNLLDLQQELAQNPSIRQCESASLGVTHELPSTASDISVDNGSSV